VRCSVARRAAAALAGAVALGGLPAGAEFCDPIPAGVDLQARIDRAAVGDTLCLAPGRHEGPLRIDRRMTLRGPSDAVVASSGRGSTISLEAEGAALEGLSVDGSGGRFDLLDAAVRVHADHVRVEGVGIRNALFGLLVEQSRDVVVRNNVIEGDADKVLGMRGDGIRLWEVRHSRIEGNRLENSRDVVVWYSPDNRIAGNRVEGGRYGTHLMYSHGNEITDNVYVANVVGIFSMYSRNLSIRRNLIARCAGAAGVGLGAKESGGLTVEDNWFVANSVGTYLDTSPLDPADQNVFAGNVFRFSDAAVIFHGVAARNTFRANSFRDNGTVVRVEGRGDAREATWRGNDYDDYAGYDLDGDGVGDLPYEVRSLSSTLETRRPALAFFRGGVAMALVELAGEALPLLRPTTLMVDPVPRMHPPRRPALPDAWSDRG
jgi:nitrous oxidase accessory protein